MTALRLLRQAQSIYAYLGAVCALAAAVIALAAGLEAQKQDAVSLQTQIAIARYETGDAYLGLSGPLIADANNDSTYDNVVRTWNEGWLIGEYDPLRTREDWHGTAVVGPTGDIRFLDERSGKNLSKSQLATAAGWSSLLGSARNDTAAAPHHSQGIVVIAGKPYFAAAAIITPTDVTTSASDGARQYTLVFFAPAKAEQFAALTAGFQAQGVHIAMHSTESGHVVLPLNDAAGVPRAWLIWQAHKPGSSFLGTLLPVLFVMLLLLAGMIAAGITYWNKAQKKFHEARSKAIAAQEESRLKTVFIGNISHELRTPLNAILGFAELMKMQILGPLGAKKYEEYVEAIFAGGQTMLRLVNDLIEIARIRAGDTAKERTPIDAAVCLNRAIEDVYPMAHKKGIAISVQTGAAGLACVGSELSLKTALIRLLENAVTMNAEGTSIPVTLEKQAGRIVFGIIDSIPTACAERLKEMNDESFLFAGDHMEAHESSVGINLEIARGLVRLMGGTIECTPLPDIGNRMTVRLPAVRD